MIKNSKKILKEKKYLVISNFIDNKIRHGGVKRADQVRELFQDFDCKFCNPYKSLNEAFKNSFKYPRCLLEAFLFTLYALPKGLSLRGLIVFTFKSPEIIKILKHNKDREVVLEGGGNLPIILMNYLNFNNIEFNTFFQNIEYLVPDKKLHNYFKSNIHKYKLEINGYVKAKSIFTISYLDSAILGCHGISSETINYYPSKKDYENLKKIKSFRDENCVNENLNHILLLGTVANPPTRQGMLDYIQSFKQQKISTKLKVAGFGTDIFKEFNSINIQILGSVTDKELKDLMKKAKCLIVNQAQTTGFLIKIVDFNIAGIPIFVTSEYYQAYNLEKFGIFRLSNKEIVEKLNSSLLENKFETFKKPSLINHVNFNL